MRSDCRVTAISDLHLFATRSRAERIYADIVHEADHSSLLILNGDIFDFDWSTLGPLHATIEAAATWLATLARDCARRDCRIVYLLGNHDDFEAWAERCESLATTHCNLEWSPDYYRLGSMLFTHGDLLLGPRARPKRPLRIDVRVQPPHLGRLYSAASGLRIPRALSLFYHGRRCARILHRNVRQLDGSLREGVRHLCVGHTHRPFSGVRVGDLIVHNTGSAVRGHRFTPLRFCEPGCGSSRVMVTHAHGSRGIEVLT